MLALQRLLVPLTTMLLVLCAATFVGWGERENWKTLGKHDLTVFWAEAKLLINGQNPYDPELATAEVARAGRMFDSEHPAMVWYPPWFYGILAPVAYLSLPLFQFGWFVLSAVLFIASAHLLCWKIFHYEHSPGPLITFSRAASLALFFPLYLALQLGQTTPLILIMLSIYFYLRNNEAENTIKGGLILSIASIKPHLLMPFFLFVGVEALLKRKVRLLVGLALGVLGLLVVASAFRPTLIQDYLTLLSYHRPTYWRNPSVGVWLHELLPNLAWIRILPLIICSFAACVFAVTRSDSKLGATMALALSLVGAPYLWTYDFSLLMPVTCCIFFLIQPAMLKGAKAFAFAIAFLLVSANVSLFFYQGEMFYTFWYPPMVTSLLLSAFLLGSQQSTTQQ